MDSVVYDLRKNEVELIGSKEAEKILDEKNFGYLGKLESVSSKSPVYYKNGLVIKIEKNSLAKVYGESKRFIFEKISDIEKLTGIIFW